MMQIKQKGFLVIVAALLIVVMGFLGIVVAYMIVGSSLSTVQFVTAEQALYIAEAGLEDATHQLLNFKVASRDNCSGVSITNSSFGAGAYQVTSTGPFSPASATTLNGALSSSATSITVASTSNYQSSGRIMIDSELINYTAKDATHFLNAVRGVGGSIASVHDTGAPVGQYQCNLSSQGGVPILNPTTTLGSKRTLTEDIQLQEGWSVGSTLSGPTNWNVLHWNKPTENQWTQQAPAISSPKILNAVSIVSNVDAWIVGNAGIALHFNGSTWSSISSGLTSGNNVLSVSAVSSSEAWACDNKGKIYKWSGGASWTNPSNPGNSLNDISVLDTTGAGAGNIGWAVGTKKMAYLYNGSTWTSTNTGITVDLNAVETLSTTDAWAAGLSGKIFQWTGGSSWNLISTPSATPTLNSISMIKSGSSDIGWAVGTSSTAWYYNGTSWASSNSGLAGGLTLNSVITISANEAWVVDSSGEIYEWNGNAWSIMFTSSVALNDIAILSPNSQPFSAWQESFP